MGVQVPVAVAVGAWGPRKLGQGARSLIGVAPLVYHSFLWWGGQIWWGLRRLSTSQWRRMTSQEQEPPACRRRAP